MEPNPIIYNPTNGIPIPPPMTGLKDYYFTDDQIDTILSVMRDKAFNSRFQDDCEKSHNDFSKYNQLANQIEDQIVNHPTND